MIYLSPLIKIKHFLVSKSDSDDTEQPEQSLNT